MRYISRALVAGGLVFLAGPLCITAQAQDYVDVEAERAAEAARAESGRPASADPYGAQPAQAYPATSYGLSNAPAAPAVIAPGVASGGQAQGQNLGNLFLQLQQLQQEVMRLNGMVEEQAHELRKLKEQSLERYVDLDRRLGVAGGGVAGGGVAGGGVAGSAVAGGSITGQAVGTGSNPVTAAVITNPLGGGQSAAAEQPGEGDAYRAAYALVRGQQFDAAVNAFRQFLQDYPDGKYAPNAHYWLGELYLVVQPQDLESARQSFMLLLSQYPDNNKAPDAMYKLGKVYFLKGNRVRAREYLDRVIRDYGSGNSSAVKLARDFIDQNY